MGSIDRRGFLKRIAAATAAAAVLEIDPEKLLWVPGKKTIVDLGAAKTVAAPTLQEVAAVQAQVRIDPENLKFSWDEAKWAVQPLDRMYAPHRYTLTVSGEHGPETLILDSDGRPRDGFHGDIRSRRRHSNKRMTMEEIHAMYRREFERSETPFIPRNRLDDERKWEK